MAGIAAILNRGRSVVDGQKKSGVGKKLGIGCLAVVGVFVGLAVIGAIVGDKTTSRQSTLATASEAPGITKVETAAEPTTSLTGPQINAARSAKEYLEMSGFSRAGLIQQLSSSAGSGYAVEDATVAVDSLSVDWNEQAVRSAKEYLEMSGFSCKGLINQLSSSAGSHYTVAQATYGAKQAGAC